MNRSRFGFLIASAIVFGGCGSAHEGSMVDGGSVGRDAGPVTPVGGACRPLSTPPTGDLNGDGRADGYRDTEVFLEGGTTACMPGGCIVYHLNGDPRPTCDDTMSECADPAEVMARVFCTCRCAAPPGSTAPTCRCPSGFSCEPVPELSASDMEGSYCLRAGGS